MLTGSDPPENLTPIMVRECEYAFDANLGSCDGKIVPICESRLTIFKNGQR